MNQPYQLDSIGIEIEYMMIDPKDLSIRPIIQQILGDEDEIKRGIFSWSAEFAAHVFEIKNNTPVQDILSLLAGMQNEVVTVAALLDRQKTGLLPTGMHPFMNPAKEALWTTYDQSAEKKIFDKIMQPGGHSWANIQATHLNIGFANEVQFVQLNNAIRILLPILPALCASTPFIEGKSNNIWNNRLNEYQKNGLKFPEVVGHIVPEYVEGIAEYKDIVLAPIYKAFKPYDLTGELCDETLNARGMIARFDRSALEIRVLDVQECVLADLAICELCRVVLKTLSQEKSKNFSINSLVSIYQQSIQHGENAIISDSDYIEILLNRRESKMRAHDLWIGLIENFNSELPVEFKDFYSVYRNQGTLSTRILKKEKDTNLFKIYNELANCLLEGRVYSN